MSEGESLKLSDRSFTVPIGVSLCRPQHACCGRQNETPRTPKTEDRPPAHPENETPKTARLAKKSVTIPGVARHEGARPRLAPPSARRGKVLRRHGAQKCALGAVPSGAVPSPDGTCLMRTATAPKPRAARRVFSAGHARGPQGFLCGQRKPYRTHAGT